MQQYWKATHGYVNNPARTEEAPLFILKDTHRFYLRSGELHRHISRG